MGRAVVLYTWLVRGHLHPMTQLANHLAGHGVPVTVAVADVPSSGKSPETIGRLSASYPSVPFHLLPPPPATTRSGDAADPDADPFITLIADLRATNPALVAFVRSLPSVKALVIDFFCSYGLDAAAELGVPAYLFFTSGASALATYLHIPVMRSAVSFRDMGRSLLRFPGVHPIPASDLPEVLLDGDNNQYKTTLGLFEQLPRAKGILANTFEWLEPRAVEAIKHGSPRPGETLPRLFCVGPLVGEERGGEQKQEFLRWLDARPARSVVFLCFGSASSVPAEQLKEIAVGLERSGHAFLWAVRAPVAPDADSTKRFEGRGEAALESLLPEGFLDRTRHTWPRDGAHLVGAAGGGAAAPGDGRVRDTLRVELDAGGGHGGGADGVLADVRGAEDEQGVRRGGDEAWGGHGRLRRGDGDGRGGGREGEAGHGVRAREGDQGEHGVGERDGRRGAGDRRIVNDSIS